MFSCFSLSFKEKVVTKVSLSCLKHLSLQLHHLTGTSFRVSLEISVQVNPFHSERFLWQCIKVLNKIMLFCHILLKEAQYICIAILKVTYTSTMLTFVHQL